MKRLLTKLTLITSLMLMTATFALPATALAQGTKDDVCQGLAMTGADGCGSGAAADAENRLGTIVETVVNILSMVVGVIAVIMIIIGGLKYITSSGDSNSINSAKNTILYAIVGLVIVALAQVIVRFVLGKL